MTLANQHIPTTEYSNASDFRPVSGALYVYGTRPEERTKHIEDWHARAEDLDLVELVESSDDEGHFVTSGATKTALRDVGEIELLLGDGAGRTLYLDITGLSNHVWPAILKVAHESNFRVQVVYVEPRDYAYSASPRENVFFDLSELISGIEPIPQFNNFQEPEEDQSVLIPLLGFEGARFRHLLEEVQPITGNVVPIVGVPGFRAEYPFFAYQGNQMPLKDSDAWQAIRFAKANCPFGLYYCLAEIASERSNDCFLKLGLIGTKPHSLGAVLFSIQNGGKTELIYDHTLRKPNRSAGKSTFHVYPVSEFLDRQT